MALADSLSAGRLAAPFHHVGVQRVAPGSDAAAVAAKLNRLCASGMRAADLACRLRAVARARGRSAHRRPHRAGVERPSISARRVVTPAWSCAIYSRRRGARYASRSTPFTMAGPCSARLRKNMATNQVRKSDGPPRERELSTSPVHRVDRKKATQTRLLEVLRPPVSRLRFPLTRPAPNATGMISACSVGTIGPLPASRRLWFTCGLTRRLTSRGSFNSAEPRIGCERGVRTAMMGGRLYTPGWPEGESVE